MVGRNFGLKLERANGRAWTVSWLLMLTLSAAGCATSIADMPLVGVPADAPARPKEPGAYPAVHDIPAAREQPALDPTEQSKISKELVQARDRQATVAGATP